MGELQAAAADLLAAAPAEIRRAADVERVFQVDHRLGWQVYRIARADNPLAAGPHVPARVSVEKLLRAALRRKIDKPVVERVTQAFERYEELVRLHAGEREVLDAMLQSLIPEQSHKHELAARAMAFKGTSQIKGVVMDAAVCACFLHPSAEPGRVDAASLLGEFGLRRIRADAPIVFALPPSALTLDGRPADLAGVNSPILPEFSSSPLPRFDMHEVGGRPLYNIAGDVGLRSAIDLVIAESKPSALRRYREPGGRSHTAVSWGITTPTKRTIIDTFVHPDLFPGADAEAVAYDTATSGGVPTFDDPARQFDRLRVHERIRRLPPGPAWAAAARLPHLPRYTEMLAHVGSRLGWDLASFRGYRLELEHPFYGAQYKIGFRLPDAPA